LRQRKLSDDFKMVRWQKDLQHEPHPLALSRGYDGIPEPRDDTFAAFCEGRPTPLAMPTARYG
jgi:hypothetical protein